MADFETLASGNASPTTPLARAIVEQLLAALARSTSSLLLDGTTPVGRVELASGFEGPDADGWYRGHARLDTDSYADGFSFPVPEPVSILGITPTLAPCDVAISADGEVRHRADFTGRGIETRGYFGDFSTAAFSPVLRRALLARS